MVCELIPSLSAAKDVQIVHKYCSTISSYEDVSFDTFELPGTLSILYFPSRTGSCMSLFFTLRSRTSSIAAFAALSVIKRLVYSLPGTL